MVTTMSKTISGTTEMPESEAEDADLFSEEGEAAFAKSFQTFHQKTTPEMAEFGRKLLLYKQHYKGDKGAYGRFLKRAIHPRVAQQYAAIYARLSKCERLSYLSGEGIRDLYSKSMPDEIRDGFLKRIRGGEDVPATEIAGSARGHS